jgi:formylglycine-generating enzyme required for sulfatase activity
MSKYRDMSRREFLEVLGLAASATVLGACTPQEPVAVTATSTSRPPTPTPLPPPVSVIDPSGIEMVLVEPGSFEMGSTGGTRLEQPVHTVNITRPFYISKYVVTFEQYDAFTDATGRPREDDLGEGRGAVPARSLWYEAIEYCNWLSEQEGFTPCITPATLATECDFSADGYRLPTEAEWEYAARGGNRSEGYIYAGSNDADEVAWYADNSGGHTHPIGQKAPNELGLYDMSGNALEWCWDWYDREYYANSPADDPRGPALISADFHDVLKMRRGGSSSSPTDELRVAWRSFDGPDYGHIAFRLVRNA